MKKRAKKLSITKETLVNLQEEQLSNLRGGSIVSECSFVCPTSGGGFCAFVCESKG